MKIMWNQTFTPWVVDDASVLAASSGPAADIVPESRSRARCRRRHQPVPGVDADPLLRPFSHPPYPGDAGNNRDRVLQMEALGSDVPLAEHACSRTVPCSPIATSTRARTIYGTTPRSRAGCAASPLPSATTRPARWSSTSTASSAYDAPLASYSWRLIGEREMLGPINGDNYPAKWCRRRRQRSRRATCGRSREAWILEATARLPYDAYSKRILAVDKQTLAGARHRPATTAAASSGRPSSTIWKHMPDAERRGSRREDDADPRRYWRSICRARRALRWRFPPTHPRPADGRGEHRACVRSTSAWAGCPARSGSDAAPLAQTRSYGS